MSKIDFEEINEILSTLDIEAYLDREGIDYHANHGSSGAQFNLKICPKCGQDKWKVYLNAESGLGNCFSGSCGEKFNKFKFIKHHTGLPMNELAEHIKSVGAEMGWRPPRKATVAVHTDVSTLKLPASYELPIEGKNLGYLSNRGITLDICRYFHLRFCHKGWFKYTVEGEDRFTNFDMRVIIPIFDLDGEMVSFQGRDITGKSEKKYLFPTGFASTGEHLYNSHNVHHTENIVVNEGVFDVAATKIALDSDAALRDVVPVGTFGKHLSVNQLAKFMVLKERGVKTITIMWDGELIATDDAIKAGMQLKGVGFNVRIAMLPKDKDPNEISAEEVVRCYYAALPLNQMTAVQMMMQRRKEAM